MRRPKLFPRVAAVSMAVLTALGLTAAAQAQHTPDPYNIVGEGNLGYEDSMYSTFPNGAGFSSNQAILQQGRAGTSRANTFQSYLDSLDGGRGDSFFAGSSRSRGTPGIPYYRAHKEFDDAFDRIYTPNAAPDETFRADQATRTKLYVEYLKEADPKKRAELYRLYNQQSRRTARDSGAGSARAALQRRTEPSTAAATGAAPGTGTRAGAGVGAATGTAPTTGRPPASRADRFRLRSGAPSTSSRLRGATSSAASESPDDILDQVTRSPASRPVTAPPRSSSVPATPR